MARVTPIRVIATTYTSERDLNGNCYHWARFVNPTRGRHESVAIQTGGHSNADHIAWLCAGEDWEGTHCTQVFMPKRQWQRSRRDVELYESTPDAHKALARLFPRYRKAILAEHEANARRSEYFDNLVRDQGDATNG